MEEKNKIEKINSRKLENNKLIDFKHIVSKKVKFIFLLFSLLTIFLGVIGFNLRSYDANYSKVFIIFAVTIYIAAFICFIYVAIQSSLKEIKNQSSIKE